MITQQSLIDYVNPFIGTAARGDDIPSPVDFQTLRRYKPGNTFPGPAMPWGMVVISPHTTFDGDYVGCQAGYYYGAPYIYGFSPNHLSGVGCPTLGNCLITPTTDELQINKNRRSKYSNEIAELGYYKCDLTDYDIRAEMTCTTRAAILRFTFPPNIDDANILVDGSHRLSWCDDKYGEVNIISDHEFEGQSIFGHFCQNFMKYHGQPSDCPSEDSAPVYFVGRLSRVASQIQTWHDGELSSNDKQKGSDVGVCFQLSTGDDPIVYLKVGISYTSIENAWRNLETEIPDWDFDGIRSTNVQAWQRELSVIEVEGGSDDDKVIFYTALYHMLLHPSLYADVNGEYSELNSNKVSSSSDYTRYSVFSLWDTYRNVHPFFTLVYPDKQLDMVKSIVAMTQEAGRLPKWELNGLETRVMAGDPTVPVLVDTYIKGLQDFDVKSAYESMYQAATIPNTTSNSSRPGLQEYMEYGYIPYDKLGGSVSVTIDYAYADWCLAQLAQALGKLDDFDYFLERSKSYRNLYDKETGLFRPRLSDGSWLTPFDATSLDGYVENNAWQYTYTAHHDVEGYVELLGGRDAYINRLQTIFDDDLYDMTNEPDIAYPFLFSLFEDEGWRTQQIIEDLRQRDFGSGADGLCGNDDCGTISAWYVFTAIGLYPLRPGEDLYTFVNPVFDRVTIQLNNNYYEGEQIVIETSKTDASARYIDQILINGERHHSLTVDHKILTSGTNITMQLSSKK